MNPANLDQEQLLLAIPWPQLSCQPSDRGANFPGNALAWPCASRRARRHTFIYSTKNKESMAFELEHILWLPIETSLVGGLSAEYRVQRAARVALITRGGGAAIQIIIQVDQISIQNNCASQINNQHKINSSTPTLCDYSIASILHCQHSQQTAYPHPLFQSSRN